MIETTFSRLQKRALVMAIAPAFDPWPANAASLVNRTVLSGLGQPLRAELELGLLRMNWEA